MTAHIMGLPIEESISQIAPAAAVMATAFAVAGRAFASRLRRRLQRRAVR